VIEVLVVAQFFAKSFDFFGDWSHARYDKWIELYRQPVLIYNPYAGKIRRNPGTLQRTTAALARANVNPRVVATDAAGHATLLARQAAEQGADLVLVLGGDGTINEAANGLAYSDVALGVLPAGTANVLAMELGLGSHLDRAIEKLSRSSPRRIALGRLSAADGASRYFLCMNGAGLDAAIVHRTNAALKDRTGKLAYWAAGLAQFPHRLENLDVRIQGQTYHCGFFLASRVRNYGGDMEIASGASLRRADFEIVLFEGSNPIRFAWYMLGVLLRRVQKMNGVRTVPAQCAEILTATHLQIDGEYAGFQTARLEIAADALTLLMPPDYR
jgi:diacylglycerol kinase (ATP)